MKCKYCDKQIMFVETETGKKMPVDAEPQKRMVRFRRGDQTIWKVVDTFTPHFATCENYKKDKVPFR